LTRFQRLAAATVIAAFVLVVLGVAVRATDSGVACPHWPGCFEGQFLPGLDSDYHVWIEWLHRSVAALIGVLIIGMAALAALDHRDRRSILWPSLAAVLLVGFQGWLGARTVQLGNTGESVTAHLAAAMALVGLLVYLLVRASYPARIPGRGASQRFTLLATFGAVATFVLLLFGSNVTAHDAALVFPDWPLMNGGLLPVAPDGRSDLAALYGAHALHRYVAAAVLLILGAIALVAWRRARNERLGAADGPPGSARLARVALAILVVYVAQVLVGGLQVLSHLAPWTQTLHVALGAVIWGGSALLLGAIFRSAVDRVLGTLQDDVVSGAAGLGGHGGARLHETSVTRPRARPSLPTRRDARGFPCARSSRWQG